MLFKLSLKNIKKSIKDYGIYFFTLIFAIAMFYMFNSVDQQSSMLKMSSSKRDIIRSLTAIINYLSVFVSIILGFLIIYSNNYLIKRRKKEIGLYFTLGMSKRKVSLVLFIENIVIGLISLGIGLLVGVFLSQFISIFVSKLFEVDMSGFKFVFSSSALIKTIEYFGVMFLLVILFSVVSLARYKLIDLLNANKKNEKIKIRNNYVTIITFILSIVLIGYGYKLLYGDALVELTNHTLIMLVSGAIGTFLLFYSMAGFLLKIVEKCKGFYYKGLNLFTFKQINNKINTTVVSTTLISLMLLLTISILAGSLSFANVFNTDFAENNLADFTYIIFDESYNTDEDGNVIDGPKSSIENMNELRKSGELDDYVGDYVYVNYYSTNVEIGMLIDDASKKELEKTFGGEHMDLTYKIDVMKESDYRSLMDVYNVKTIDFDDGEYLLLANLGQIKKCFDYNYETKTAITMNGNKLYPGSEHVIEQAVENYSGQGNSGVLVVKDDILFDDQFIFMDFIGNYKDGLDKEQAEKDLSNKVSYYAGYISRTKLEMEASSLGIKVIAMFLGMYLGLTFAICSATVLAIGQLSESSDNKLRYNVLRKIGTDEKLINKGLFFQIGIVFLFPLVVALVHSIVALNRLNVLLKSMGSVDLMSNIVFTTIFMLVLYGGYFAITYISSKRIVRGE